MSGFGSLVGARSSFMQGVVEGISEGAVEEGSKLTKEQQDELFRRIRPAGFFHNVFVDYWNVVVTLIGVLRSHGKDIWLYDTGKVDNIATVIQSMSNPNYPQDKVLDTVFDFILKQPTEALLYKLLEDKYGTTEETKAIFDYFLYPDFATKVYTPEDFPASEAADAPQQEAQTAQQSDGQNTSDEPQNTEKKSGLFSSFTNKLNNLDGEKVKKGLKIGAGVLAAGVMLGGLAGKGSSSSKKQSLWGTAMCPHGRLAREYDKDAPDFMHITCPSCPHYPFKCSGRE